MRRAFDATMKDPGFLIDAEKARLELDPVSGEDIEKLLTQVYNTPRQMIQRANDLSK
jgi:hypothetical protein